MLNQSSGQFTTRAADDRPNGARNIGTLNGSRAFRGAVGTKDKADFYSFTLTGRSSFNLALNKLKDNVNVSLLQGGKVLSRSAKGGKKPEAIATTLEAGTYYVRVNQKSGNSKYRLTLNATPTDPGGTVLPPPPLGKFKVLAYSSTLESGLLKVDIDTGATTVLANEADSDALNNFREVAVFGDQIYVTKGESIFGQNASDSGLYKVDPNTGALTKIGDTGLTYTRPSGTVIPWSPTALGFTSSGALYGVYSTIDAVSNQASFYSIDTTTGKATFIADLNPEDSNGIKNGVSDLGLSDIAYDSGTGRFWGIGYTTDKNGLSALKKLVSIGLAGDVQSYDSIAIAVASTTGGLAIENGTLYGYTTITGEQIAFDLNKIVSNPRDFNYVPVTTKLNPAYQIVGAG